ALRGMGDVLIAWESEAFLILGEFGADGFEIVVPSESILAEPPVSIVDKNVDRKGTRALAEAYLRYLYTEEGQALAVKHHYRPRSAQAAAKASKSFAPVKLFALSEVAGDWKRAQKQHFDDGGTFDQLYVPQAK
ncbi:MAG: sulfate ABC transporter substrate-binding protein, partial [Cystobacter sp.]